MATRCTVIVKKGDDKAYLYRHFDGYPESAGYELKAFMESYSNEIPKMSVDDFGDNLEKEDDFEFENACVHGDEGYIYVVDIEEMTIKGYKVDVTQCASENVDEFELVFDEKT